MHTSSLFLSRWVALAAFLFSIALVGCADVTTDEPEDTTVAGCTTDGDCNNGYTCVEGSCQMIVDPPECVTDADCEEPDTCENGECMHAIEPPDCTDDSECADGETCSNGFCQVVVTPDCTEDGDCEAGEKCMNGECMSTPPGCTTDDDCEAGETCNNGTCETTVAPDCTTDEDCEAGETCIEDECVTVVPSECKNDDGCDEGKQCVNGQCIDKVPDPDCTADGDCADGEFCDKANGTCQAKGMHGAACQDNNWCLSNLCFKESVAVLEGSCLCVDDKECPLKEVCNDNGECENEAVIVDPPSGDCEVVCNDDQYCDKTAGACVDKKTSGNCVSGDQCLSGVCKSLKCTCDEALAPCTEGTGYCDAATGKCAVKKGAGENCDQSLECLAGQCYAKKCACGDKAPCASGQYCGGKNPTCSDLKNAGSVCSNAQECLTGTCPSGKCGCTKTVKCPLGSVCQNGACSGAIIVPPVKKNYGEQCTGDSQCASGKCSGKKCGCTDTSQCPSGNYCKNEVVSSSYECKPFIEICDTCTKGTDVECGPGKICQAFSSGLYPTCIEVDAVNYGKSCCKGQQCSGPNKCWDLGSGKKCYKGFGVDCTGDGQCFSENCNEGDVCGCKTCINNNGCDYGSCLMGDFPPAKMCMNEGSQAQGAHCCADKHCAGNLQCKDTKGVWKRTCQP